MSHDQCHKEGCHHQQGSCSCSCKKCSCCCHDEDHSCHHGEHEDFSQQLLEMADEAWMEVLKEKIKEQILSASGAHLDQLAKLVAESNAMRWKSKMSSQKSCNEYKDKISAFFNKGSC